MGDKYANGFVSGLIGGVAAAATNLLLILFFKFGNVMFGDFTGVLVFGPNHIPIAAKDRTSFSRPGIRNRRTFFKPTKKRQQYYTVGAKLIYFLFLL